MPYVNCFVFEIPGRLPHVPVEWAEINAAWGQTALLLWALARKVGITFNKYQVGKTQFFLDNLLKVDKIQSVFYILSYEQKWEHKLSLE